MSNFQYDIVKTKADAKKALFSNFSSKNPFFNSVYFNKIILVSETDANYNLLSEMSYFFKEKKYNFVELEDDCDFTEFLISKQESEHSNTKSVYILNNLPECQVNNAFILHLDY
jgi:hypothetical protein